jgi:histidinol-phosphate aminotransferase
LRSAGAVPVWVPLKSNAIDLAGMLQSITSKTRLVFLNVPFNPTGAILTRSEFDNFLSAIPPQVVVVMDEAYIEFVRDPDCVRSLDYIQSDRLIVGMRTFSKAYGLAGLRVGYGFMAPPLAELLNRVRQPFNVNSLAQVGAMAALKDDAFLQTTTRLVHAELDFLYASLKSLGLEYMPSQANFLMINVGRSADDVFEQLLKRGVIVRSMSSYSYPEYIRVNIGLHSENVRFLGALEKVI